jgi:hypothetical protein
MKNLFRLFGIIALAAVIGFSMAACGGGGDDDDGGSNGISPPSQLVGEWNSSDGQGYITIKSDGEINSLYYKFFFFILSSSTLKPTSGTIVFGYSEMLGESGRFSYSISGNTMTISNSNYYDFPDGTYQKGSGGGGGNTVTYTGTSGNANYTLKITGNTAAAQSGDAYELTAGTKKSAGTVNNVSGGVLTLKPSNAAATFTATVSGNSLAALNGTITWTDKTTASAPGALTGGGGIPVNPGGGGDMAWTAVANSTFGTTQINAIAYGNNKFVAVGEDGKMAYSSDGKTWTAVSNSTFGSDIIEAIAFGNGTFVAVGGGGKIAYSSNGTSWTAATNILYSPYLRAIAYGNNMFVAGGGYGTVAYSSNGITWTRVDISDIMDDIGEIAYGNGTFVASDYYSGTIVWSTNGTTWTAVDVESIFEKDDGIGDRRGAIAYGNNKFVLIGNDDDYEDVLLTSPDGKTWTQEKVNEDNFIYDCEAIVYVNNKFVAVGNLGWVMTSTNGTSWTLPKYSDTNIRYKIYALAYGNGTFVVGGKDGKMSYSSEGSGGNTGNNPQTANYTGTSGGTNYTLKITENTARYTAQSGDAYELTAGTKKSAGTVNNVSGSVLTLKPSNAAATFTATVSGSILTALNGTITWTDNTTAAAPGTFATGTNPGGGGDTLTLSSQVYTQGVDESTSKITYTPYTGPDKNFTGNVGGTGSIKNGQMSFSIGVPDTLPLLTETITGGGGSLWANDVKLQPSNTQGVGLAFYDVDLDKMNINIILSPYSLTLEMIMYIYVDRDCTITSSGGSDGTGSTKRTFSSMNLSLKKGWNPLNHTTTSTTTGQTMTLRTGDLSSCKWVLGSNR